VVSSVVSSSSRFFCAVICIRSLLSCCWAVVGVRELNWYWTNLCFSYTRYE
jgi:hypothetical protein